MKQFVTCDTTDYYSKLLQRYQIWDLGNGNAINKDKEQMRKNYGDENVSKTINCNLEFQDRS